MKLKQFIFAFMAMLLCFSVSVNAQVAMVGNTEYATIEAAFAAATEGQTITVLVDATPALSSQRAITKAAVIDLGGKTMTLTEDDLYFGTTTFKNGTIVVDPSVKPSTAVFWMFANQTLTFDNVKIVATGVTGTYLIGLDGNNSDLNLLNGSEIVVENTSALDLDIICVNASTGNDIKVENSKVNVTNLDGRVFFRGNYTVKDSEVNLAGITKAGFRIEAGQKLSIEGTSVVNIAGEPRDGGIHLTDLTATYTKAETATVNATVNEPKVAKVGENTYRTLAQAVAAVEDGGTITLIANETFTKNNRYNNGGYWDGLGYSGDKSFTIDLADFTISQNGELNDYLMWFKNDGAKANTITLMNGTLDAGTTAYSALATSSSNAQKITVNLENINVINNNSNGAALKIRGGSELNVKAGTIITGQNSYLGIEAVGKTTVVNIYEGAEIYQNGTSSYCGCLAGASGNSTINVYGGKGQSKSGGFIAMTSGGTINIEGGEWTANTDGTYANGNKSVLVAQSDKQYNAGAGNSIVNVTGGTFKGGYNCYGNAVGDAQINIKGGNFNADPTSYVAENYVAVENNGVWNVVKAAAKIGKQGYATFADALAAVKGGDTLTLLADLNMSEILVLDKAITLDGNGKTLTSTAGRAINVDCNGNVGIKNLTINASGERAINVIQKPANVTIEGVTATAANYTVNVAASAGAAKVAIIGSNLTGLNVVNVAAAGANVTIDNSIVNCNDNNTTAGESYAALCLNKAAVGASIVATNTTVNVTEGSDSEKGRNGAENGTVTINGSTEGVTVTVAVITYPGSDNYHGFTSLADAIEFAKAGNTITLIRDITASDILTINKAITLDGNGKKLTSSAGRAINVSGADGVTIKNLTINASGERAINVIQNATNVTIENVTATAANYTVNLASSAGAAKVAIANSNLTGLNVVNVGAPGSEITINGGTITCNDQNANENYAALALNKDAVGAKIAATGVTFDIKGDSKKAKNGAEGGVITIDGKTDEVAVNVAYIKSESDYYYAYTSIEAAIEAAKAGETIVLIRDVEASKVILLGKSVTINGNGHKVTSSANRVFRVTTGDVVVTMNDVNMISTAFSSYTNDIRGISIDGPSSNVKLTLNNCSVDFDPESGSDWAYAVNMSSGCEGHTLTINGGTYEGANVINIWGNNHKITIDGATLNNLYNAPQNNYYGQCVRFEGTGCETTIKNSVFNGVHAVVVGEKTPGANTVAQENNTDNTKTYDVKAGTKYYYTLAEAFAAVEDNATIEVRRDIEETETVVNTKNVVLDLNGKTVTMVYTQKATKNHTMISNSGNLTIQSSVEGGKLSYTYAGENIGTTYSVNTVTSNPGSILTVKSGTIENLTYDNSVIAYAIDGLTNGGAGDVTVNIEGGVITSKRQAVRIFANSTTNTGALNISGGDFTGRVIVQNASAKANKAALNITGGTFNANEYKTDVLYVGGSSSAEIDINASVSGGTFKGEITDTNVKGFITGGTFDNLIDETFLAMGYQLTGDAAPYTVAYTGEVTELVLVDGEVTEFVNEKEVTVGTLTYKRSNIKNTWTPFYVPFAVPVSALEDKFDVAYINDVRRTDSDDDGELDKFSMEIIYIHGGNANGSAKTLKANYPYFIRSKSGQTETMEITLTDAKVYAKENVFDCTTMTEKFEIKGNYHQIPSDKLTENDYVVGGGEWHPLADGYSLNPFRFYMTKSSRYEDEPAAPMQSMRIIVCGEEDENGATIIYDVVEDSLNNNGNDFIYDLQGRRVSEPKKGGIYIKNGKKILF